MKKYIVLSILLLLVAIVLFSGDRPDTRALQGKISGFAAEDIPFDDGSGVVLRWKPLDKSHRIIQYNVYRGVHPDSLFMLNHIEVDPKLGVLSDELFFYDKDYPTLIDFETAPAKLKPEKQQAPGSPLLRRMPRDPKVLATMLDRYSVMGILNSRNYYRHSKKVILPDSSFAAGIKLNQFEYLMANVNQGQTYYYTVLGVNERGQLLPFADVQSVIPVNNRPDSTAIVRAAYLEDTGELSFEWNPPVTAKDIASWQAWLVPNGQVPTYHTAQTEAASHPFEGSYAGSWQASSIKVFDIPAAYQAPNYYHKESLASLNLPQGFDPTAYHLVLGYVDYEGLDAYCMARQISKATSADIPVVPDYKILDKKNDKGDYLYVSIEKPLVFITQASYTDSKHDRLRINYEISENEAYTIDKIRFSFFEDNKAFGEVTEHFVDQIIQLKLPASAQQSLSDLTVKIAVKTTADKGYDNPELIQHLEYDTGNRRFGGNRMEYEGQRLNRLYYDLYTTVRLDGNFAPGNRMGGLSRGYDLNVPYENEQYPLLYAFDPASQRFAIDPNMIVATDAETGASLSVPIYRDEFEPYLADLKEEISSLESKLNQATDEEEIATLNAELDYYKATLELSQKHPAVLTAQKKGSNRAWLSTFIKERDRNLRSYAFQLLATDGRGLHSISEVYTADGSQWFYPKNEWFDSTKWITLIGSLILVGLVAYGILIIRRKDPYIRPIAGLEELDNAVGRATEMGRPVMFVPGWGTLGDPCTISAMMILSQIARKTAEFDIRLISPHVDYFVVPVAQEMVKTAYSEVGRPDSYNQNDIFFVSDVQFAFSAAVNGITIRDRVATIFYMGYFNAEALLMTETGNQTGAIQIAASDAITQIPFFITTCDYTLIGEEFYAASAYLSKNPDIVSMLKSQDYFKLIIVITMIVGAILSSLHINGFIRAFPVE